MYHVCELTVFVSFVLYIIKDPFSQIKQISYKLILHRGALGVYYIFMYIYNVNKLTDNLYI